MTAEGPRFGATPQNPDLLRWIGIQVLLLVLAWVIGLFRVECGWRRLGLLR